MEELKKRYHLFIVTQRRPQTLEFVREWLAQHDMLRYFSSIVSTGEIDGVDKIKEQIYIELGLDALIDDDIRHLENINLLDLRKILLNHGGPENIELPNGIEYARSWDEVVKRSL